MTKNYIADTEKIMERLEAEGLGKEAQSLRDAIEAGSTGGEIYGAVRFNLERIEQAHRELSPPLRRAIRDLISGM